MVAAELEHAARRGGFGRPTGRLGRAHFVAVTHHHHERQVKRRRLGPLPRLDGLEVGTQDRLEELEQPGISSTCGGQPPSSRSIAANSGDGNR